MRRVLVPLDGSKRAESILPDALRLAGSQGELILVRDAGWERIESPLEQYDDWSALKETEHYLDVVSGLLVEAGVHASAYRITAADLPAAIDEIASSLDADVIACATHGRSPIGRLMHGSFAWRALAGSRLPVLLRHWEGDEGDLPREWGDWNAQGEPLFDVGETIRNAGVSGRHILVPLDGSAHAEAALPLASELAIEWSAPLSLVRVVPDRALAGVLSPDETAMQAESDNAKAYLETVAAGIAAQVHAAAVAGSPVDTLLDLLTHLPITDVVMTTHGRTGLGRVVFGSVADALIQHVHCPTVIIPPAAARRIQNDAQSHSQISSTLVAHQ